VADLPRDLIARAERKGAALLSAVRRRAGLGPSFPIPDYDELTAKQVTERLPFLASPQLRKVRDRERRTARRKTVLAAIEAELADR
jgi:hypothetical protein